MIEPVSSPTQAYLDENPYVLKNINGVANVTIEKNVIEKVEEPYNDSDVVNGKADGRKNDQERILAYNIGISIHDIYYAYEIYNMLKADGAVFDALTDADMKDPKEKFWI